MRGELDTGYHQWENTSDIKGIFWQPLRFGLDLNNDTVTSDAEDAHPTKCYFQHDYFYSGLPIKLLQ